MAQVTLRELLEAGVHFGHQTRRWNPKMRRFIHGERSGIHIIDLQRTEKLLAEAQEFASGVAGRGGTVLFVGTKKQARDTIAEAATAADMPYIHQRWLGGLLTNFQTVSKRIKRLHELTDWTESGTLDLLPTRERIAATKERDKLEFNLGGVRNMQRPPDALFVVDLKTEEIAVREAVRLRIPIIGLVDTNCDPDPVTYVVPGNDDAIRSCKVIIEAIAGEVAEQHQRFRTEEEAARREKEEQERLAQEEQQRKEAEEAARREAEEQARKEAEEAGQAPPPPPEPEPAPTGAEQRTFDPNEGTRDDHLGRRRQGAARAQRRGDHGRQGRAPGDRRRHGQGHGAAAREGPGQGRQARRAGRERGAGPQLRAPQRQGRRAGGGRLRDRLRGAQRRVRRVRARGRLPRGRAAPMYVTEDDVPEDTREAEMRVLREQAAGEGKPEEVQQKIAEGRMKKWLEENVLLNQSHINADKHDGQTIEELRAELSANTGENVVIRRFARFRIGE